MYGFGGVGLSEVQISISELSVVGGGWWTGQTHFMVGPGRGPTIIRKYIGLDIRKRWRVRQSCKASLVDKSGEKVLKIQEHKHKHKNTCSQVHGRTSTTSPK